MLRTPRRQRETRSLPSGALLGSVFVHVLLGLGLFQASHTVAAAPPMQTYRVSLAAPAPEEAPQRLEPRPAEVAEEEHEPPPPEPSEEPVPETERPTVVEREPTRELPSEEPARAPEEGTDPINVELEGVSFEYPEYLEEISVAIDRHWRPPTGGRSLRAELSFTILRDGSVEDIEWVSRSGDLSFDLEARGAVEAAGRNRAFGPLPEEYPRDALRVSFFFDPTTR